MAATEPRRNAKAPAWQTYYVTLPYALLAHAAWLTLVPKAQIILIDFKRHLDRMTIFGHHPIPRGGIPYSHGHCINVVHRNTFYKNIRELEDRGFLRGTDQIDIDGQSTYYLPSSRWMTYEPPSAEQAKIDRLKARIRHRENRDLTLGCRISVHPPSHFERNPLLKFWTDPTAYLPKKSAPLPYDQNKRSRKTACASPKQETIPYEPTVADYNPEEGQAQRSEFLQRLRAKQTALRQRDAAAIEATRAFPTPTDDPDQ